MTGNTLKIIAAIAMLIDHVGLMFFPEIALFRIIGRLAFPIFAFMIAEGCKYTRSRLRYFLQLFGLALGCQIVYFIADGSMYLSVLFTFSLAVLTIFALQYCKAKPTALPILLFVTAVTDGLAGACVADPKGGTYSNLIVVGMTAVPCLSECV